MLKLQCSLLFVENGTVDFNEFLAMYTRKKKEPGNEEEEMRAAFKVKHI